MGEPTPVFEHIHGTCYRTGDMILDTAGTTWWTLRAPAEPGVGWLHRPGPWKPANADGDLQVCDLPVRPLRLDGSRDGLAGAAPLWDWLAATRRGAIPLPSPPLASATLAIDGPAIDGPAIDGPAIDGPAIDGPAIDGLAIDGLAIEAWQLTAQAGPFACQGTLHHGDDGRTYLDYEVAARPASLSDSREAWLDATLRAARAYRMVRVETHPDTRAVHARVDLTGCPTDYAGPWLGHAAACLRAVVAALLPALSTLTDANVFSRALELGALAPLPMKRR